ncbi:ABC transporter ATP-binding protein [Desulfitobacterium metallireducens]|uniref:ABC transporter n=1 Tax=Desulfitobacterium metallireducens DSM 15288 TaxID=871968 RepID=W0EBG9_9FIRM|nr:ABC transporter ATP-binding protein [Desulfitobacterium metallireducens]AHF08185.1 ABC transporter [Desulfitobacterium metallireducens DSM 15288]
MFKILKHLKGSALVMTAIITLLFLQAFCDLSLPAYTSDIVNIGIQQGGIKDAVPTDIRQSELEKLTFFMTPEDAAYVRQSYKLGEPVKGEPVLQLAKISQEERSNLNRILGKAILVRTAQAKGLVSSDFQLQSQLPDTLITQIAVSYVKSEYQALGKDLNTLQANYILLAGAKMIALALLAMLFSVLVVILSGRVAASLSRILRDKVFKKVISFSNTELDRFSTASLITRSTNDIQQIQMMMTMLFRFVIYAPILAIGGTIMAVKTEVSMAWIIALGAGTILALIAILMSVAMPRFKRLQTLIDKLNLVSREILTGIPVIRAFVTQKHEEKRFDEANKNLTEINLFVNRIMTFMMPTMMLIMNAITVLIIYKGAYAIDSGAMQVGDMMAFIQYTMQIIMSFLMISMLSIMLPRASVSATRINEVLETEPIIHDPVQPLSPDAVQKGIIEFRNVSFHYPDANEDVLSQISFTAKPGETTAFIGSTGSGKSTLVNLIPRFFDISEGEILVDGMDIRQMSQKELRQKIGYVPQKGVLFSGTISSNLRFGQHDAADEEIKKAARIAQATEFIEQKEEQYASPIAQGGSNVSGGQKQRLSIARAIAKKPEIYIFDDSFSALDYKTDVLLRRALKQETESSTTLIVAQRVNTILQAEQILVLEEGRIVGRGTHNELLESCEIYRQIALSQLSEEELNIQFKDALKEDSTNA